MSDRRAGPAAQFVARSARTARLLRMLVPRELRVRYRQSFLDVAWALVAPVVTVAVYGIVLTQSFGVTTGCAPYLSTAWIGLVFWTFFASAVGTAVHSLIGSADLLSKLYFPREALPLSMVGATLLDFALGLATIVPLLLVQHVAVSVTWVAILLPVAVTVVWAAAIGVIVAILAAFVRDVVHAVQLALRVGFFGVPVMYEAASLPARFAWTGRWNPLAASITGARTALLCGGWPDAELLGIHLAVGVALLVLSVLYAASIESRITDVV